MRAWKQERRKVYRQFHPDRGGTVDELITALAEVDAKYNVGSDGSSAENVYIYSTVGPWGVISATLLRFVKALGRLPRRRTYFDI